MASAKTTALVLPLADDGATLEVVGGKGASLARLARAGLAVPPGFHVTTAAYRRFVAGNNVQEAIEAAASAADADRPETLEQAEADIRARFEQGELPRNVAAAIRRAYKGLGEDAAVAVRSSATAEDLPDLSFAGQQESYLNISGDAAVLDAVKRCWASLWTARAIGYRARHGIAPGEVSLAVVVQALVPAEASGVLFTADPVSGARDRAVISVAWGLGEAIVGGLVTPDSVTVDKQTGSVIDEQVADKAVRTVRGAEGTRTEPTPDEQRRAPVLSAAQATELARLGSQIEQLYGLPVDVEWTLHDGAFAIVQARPITALPEPPAAATTDWPLPDPHCLYYRSSVIELLPDPLSPLFATLALPEFNAAMRQFIRMIGAPEYAEKALITTINGYAYYAFDASRAPLSPVFRMAPHVVDFLRRTRARWEDEARPAYVAVVDRWQAKDAAVLPAAQLVAGVREIVASAARYYLTIQSGILPAAYGSESLFSVVYERLIRRADAPPALTFMLGFASEPIRAEMSLYDLAAWARGQTDLAAWLARAPSGAIARQLGGAAPEGVPDKDWQEIGQRFGRHLAQFGHTIYDLDFAQPVPADDPAPLLDALKFFVSGQAADPRARQAAAAQRREQAEKLLVRRLGRPRRELFVRLLRLAQGFAPLREDALADVGLGWPLVRRMLRALGERLVAAGALARADHVFWLEDAELTTAVAALDAGAPMTTLQTTVAERRALAAAQRRLTPPPQLPERAKFLGIDMRRWLPARTEQEADGAIRGIGASPGRVTGTARVLRGPEEFDQMRPGDILVAKITTPAWTPLFALAAGVVTDVGGPLSHSSIVAREYHIPAVLGTGVATERLQSGTRITVDGDAGTVEAHA